LAIGETSAIESEDKGKIQDIAQKVRDLNGRLQDIRREQVFQRVSAVFPNAHRKMIWIGKALRLFVGEFVWRMLTIDV
jgi:hypothetical protein